jgi:hypothetical protein
MSDLRNLFIVTEKGVFIGRGKLHKDLAKSCNVAEHLISYGGGVFDQRSNKDSWILFGKSFDFGKFDTEMLTHFIKTKEVFWLRRKLDQTFVIDEDRIEKESDRF